MIPLDEVKIPTESIAPYMSNSPECDHFKDSIFYKMSTLKISASHLILN